MLYIRGTYLTLLFYSSDVPNKIDGILGLSYQALSSVQAVPVFEAFVNAGYYKNIFSICLGPNGGTLTLVIILYYNGLIQKYLSNPL